MVPDLNHSDRLGVLVGYDGSASSGQAVMRAAHEAVLHGAELDVVAVLPAEHGGRAGRDLTRVAEAVERHHPALTVRLDRRCGAPAATLSQLSSRAVLVVVGARGSGDAACGLGSVSTALLEAAGAPVLVVPDRQATGADTPVVVAVVDADALAPAVLRTAVTEARLRGGRVRLLHAYASHPTGEGLQEARRFSRGLIRSVVGDDEDAVTCVVTPEPPDAAVVRHAARAGLVVVGSHLPCDQPVRRSVSRAVVEALPCAVLVLTPRAAGHVPACRPLPHAEQAVRDGRLPVTGRRLVSR
jgi:nucleotide-binding universal stress UspA family protein